MTTNNRQSRLMLMILVAMAAFDIGSNQAQAQFRGGWGGGFGGFNYVSQPTDILNQQATVNASHAHGPVSNNVYANNPNSYINHVRDNGFETHYAPDPARRFSDQPDDRPSPNVSQTSHKLPRPATATPTVPRPVVPIASFFDASRKLEWPSDAPVAGDLSAKRDISDQACLVVFDEVEKHKSAPITTVTDARKKLLDYGQPALQDFEAMPRRVWPTPSIYSYCRSTSRWSRPPILPKWPRPLRPRLDNHPLHDVLSDRAFARLRIRGSCATGRSGRPPLRGR